MSVCHFRSRLSPLFISFGAADGIPHCSGDEEVGVNLSQEDSDGWVQVLGSKACRSDHAAKAGNGNVRGVISRARIDITIIIILSRHSVNDIILNQLELL